MIQRTHVHIIVRQFSIEFVRSHTTPSSILLWYWSQTEETRPTVPAEGTAGQIFLRAPPPNTQILKLLFL